NLLARCPVSWVNSRTRTPSRPWRRRSSPPRRLVVAGLPGGVQARRAPVGAPPAAQPAVDEVAGGGLEAEEPVVAGPEQGRVEGAEGGGEEPAGGGVHRPVGSGRGGGGVAR